MHIQNVQHLHISADAQDGVGCMDGDCEEEELEDGGDQVEALAEQPLNAEGLSS